MVKDERFDTKRHYAPFHHRDSDVDVIAFVQTYLVYRQKRALGKHSFDSLPQALCVIFAQDQDQRALRRQLF